MEIVTESSVSNGRDQSWKERKNGSCPGLREGRSKAGQRQVIREGSAGHREPEARMCCPGRQTMSREDVGGTTEGGGRSGDGLAKKEVSGPGSGSLGKGRHASGLGQLSSAFMLPHVGR